MAVVHIPALIQDLTEGQDQIDVEVAAGTRVSVRELLAKVESRYPGVQARLLAAGELVPGIAVFINGEQSRLGLLSKAEADAEIHFIPPVVGG